ncbi:MAG TPA: ferrous iron transport protein A [Veillonellaceae bacterium]|jgi:ferrous iron transport protein A|nr:ferrous iron transport protein A [Veillonellaceae bacterium]
MMPLTLAAAGETVVIRKISGKDTMRQHLADMGFVVDAEVTVVSRVMGNLIIQVKGSRVAIDQSVASRIFC